MFRPLADRTPDLVERGSVILAGGDGRLKRSVAVEQQHRARMLHLLAGRGVGHRLGIDAVLLLHGIDLRIRSGETDDRGAEQLGILADLLRAVVLRVDRDEDDRDRSA